MTPSTLHRTIAENGDRIVGVFVRKARRRDELPTGGLTDQEAGDHLKEYLQELARALETGDTASVRGGEAAREHGTQRWYLGGYDLKSVIREYGVLRSAVVEVAGTEHPPTVAELDALAAFLNEGIADAAAEFAAKSMEEIERARGEAEAAVAAREELLSIVSHDLRNPLGVLLGTSTLLAEAIAAADLNERRAEISKYARTLARNAERAVELTTDLLDLSRIKAGHLDLQEAEEDVEALVRDACADATPTAEQRSVRLLAVVPRSGTVVCDRARIRQVFANLIENAIKFSPEGGTVTVQAFASDGRFEVQDEAGGIPAEQIPRLFDRFWQAPDRARGGTGLGLAIAKGIIESHGGQIGVESTVGAGSTFFFTLPRRRG